MADEDTRTAQRRRADRSSTRTRDEGRRRVESAPDVPPAKLAKEATRQLLELTGKATEGVVGLEKDGDGWRIQVEILEMRRVPTTTDVLALYEIDADRRGNLQGYRRIRRYTRGSPGDE